MVVYLINIALILFWRLYYTQNRGTNPRKKYCTIVAIQWILVSGLRDWTIGADTYNYYSIFERAKSISWGEILRNFFDLSVQNVFDVEAGYVIINKLIQLFSKNYQFFLIAVAAFFMSMMAMWIYRYSASPCTSFILFSTLFYSYETLMRQIIAIALVVFWGYEAIKNKKPWKFMAILITALLIHKSALFFLPVYFLSQIPITLGYMIVSTAAIAIVAILGKKLYVPIAMWMGFGEGQFNYAEGGAELYTMLLILLCAVIWILYPRIKKHREDANVLLHINSMNLMVAFLVLQNQSFMRIQLYFSLFLMITIPEVINLVKREYRLLVYFLFGTIMILYLIHCEPQYQFFFMS